MTATTPDSVASPTASPEFEPRGGGGPYLLVTGDFVKTGGMDRANYALATYLAARGAEVHLVAHRVADDLRQHPNLIVHPVPKPLGSYFLGGPFLDRIGRRLAADMAARGGRVVVNGGNCRFGDVNWVHHIHAVDAPRPTGGPLRRLKGHLDYRLHVADERSVVPRARIVITGCEKARRDLIERLNVAPERVHAVYYGVDAAIFRPADAGEQIAIRSRLGWPHDRPKVAFVGALGDRRKGFDTLFATWARLCTDPAWDADLVVVGRGAEVDVWRARAAQAGLAEKIAFLGFVPNLPELYRACDAHCLPSRYEGYSLVTQEALASGIPAFVTRSAGIAERYPKALHNLLIDDPEDISALTAALRAWRSELPRFRTEVVSFSAEIRAQTWDVMAERIVQLIAEPAA